MTGRSRLLRFALPIFLMVCAGLGLGYLRTENFQEHVRRRLLTQMESATGLRCSLRHLTLDIYHGRFSMEGLALVSRTPGPGALALHVARVHAKIGIASLWHGRMRLAELTVLRPRLDLSAGGAASSWNPEEMLQALQLSLRLEAGRVEIRDGWIQVNARARPFHVRLEDLDWEIRYVRRIPGYKIRIAYRKSRIHWEQRDILHDLEMVSDVSAQGMAIERFRLRRGASLFEGSGSLNNWRAPQLRLRTSGTLDARDLVLATASLFEGRGAIRVRAHLQCNAQGVSAQGTFFSAHGKYRKMAYRALAGKFAIRGNELFLREVTGKIARGTIAVRGDIQLRMANRNPNRIAIQARNVPIIEAGRLLNLPLLNFENPFDIRTVLVWHGGKPLQADCEAYVHGMEPGTDVSGRQSRLDGPVRFTYIEPGAVAIAYANLKSPHSTVQVSGGQEAPFHVRLSTTRIAEPMRILSGFSPPVADLMRRYPDLTEMSGRYELDGSVRIRSSEDVHYQGRIAIRNGRWRSFSVDSLTTQAEFASPRLQLQSMVVQSGRQKVQGDLEMEIAAREKVSGIRFRGEMQQVALDALKDFGVPADNMGGALSGSGTIRLKEDAWEGDGTLVVERGHYDREPFDRLRARLQLRNRQLNLIHAEVSRGAMRLTAEGRWDMKSRQMHIPVQLRGMALEEMSGIRTRRLPIRGSVHASGILTGTPENPAFAGTLESDSLHYGRWSLGKAQGRVEMKDGALRGQAGIASDLGRVTAAITLSLGDGYPGNAQLEFADLNVRRIVPAGTPSYLRELSTDLSGKVHIQGKFADLSTIAMRGTVDGARFRIHEYALRNADAVQLALENGQLRIENARFVGDGTSLMLTGTLPLENTPRLDLALTGTMNLQLLEGMQKNADMAGSAQLNIRASGFLKNPHIIGRASLQEGRLDMEGLPSRISAIQGEIVFSRNSMRLENIRGTMASGTLQLNGAVEHENAVFRSVNMGITIRNARLQYPKDFRSVVDADLVLSGTREARILGGDVHVLRMEYAKSFNLLEQLASRGSIQSGPLTTDPALLGLRLNLELHSDNGLHVENELVRLRGSFRLALRGTPAYPSLTGRVEATEGTIFFRGNRFAVMRAAANFIDRNRINPVLEVRAEADVKTYRLILDAAGDLEHLNLNLTSDPVMSTVDILSLLTTGKSDAHSVTAQRESQLAGISAASVLSENLTGVIGKRVQRIFGLESFRVDPFLAGAENDPTARITISERLSKDMVVTFSRNLSTHREQIVVIEYDVTRDLSMVATRDENGKFGLDFRLRKRWR